MGSERLPLSEASMGGGRQNGPYSWSVLRSSAIHPGPVHAGQDDGEPSHKGRTREYEQNCELGVGQGQ